MQFRQIGACMQRKYAFIGIQRAIGRANDVIEEGRPMSVNGRFCCKSRLRQAANRDSVVLTRISARSIHDGPSEE